MSPYGLRGGRAVDKLKGRQELGQPLPSYATCQQPYAWSRTRCTGLNQDVSKFL